MPQMTSNQVRALLEQISSLAITMARDWDELQRRVDRFASDGYRPNTMAQPGGKGGISDPVARLVTNGDEVRRAMVTAVDHMMRAQGHLELIPAPPPHFSSMPVVLHCIISRCDTLAGSERRLLPIFAMPVSEALVNMRQADAWRADLMRTWGDRDRQRIADPEIWCNHCLRDDGHHAPRADRYRQLELCRWCGDFRSAQGVLPPLSLLQAHHRGERITEAMVDAALRQVRRKSA